MKVAYHPLVIDFLEELTFEMYKKGYFGFYDAACDYVDRMVDDVNSNIQIKIRKKAPAYFNKYGKNMSYISSVYNLFFNGQMELANNHSAV